MRLCLDMLNLQTSLTPRLVIERVLQKAGDACEGWALTAVHGES